MTCSPRLVRQRTGWSSDGCGAAPYWWEHEVEPVHMLCLPTAQATRMLRARTTRRRPGRRQLTRRMPPRSRLPRLERAASRPAAGTAGCGREIILAAGPACCMSEHPTCGMCLGNASPQAVVSLQSLVSGQCHCHVMSSSVMKVKASQSLSRSLARFGNHMLYQGTPVCPHT